MTGFGQASGFVCGYRIKIDIRSLNHRYREVLVRLPREWGGLEDRVRKQVSAAVLRGHIEVQIAAERDVGAQGEVEIDWSAADGYVQAARKLQERYGFEDGIGLSELLALPGVIQFREEAEEEDDKLAAALIALLDQALEQMLQMRLREGAHLLEHITSRLDKLEEIHRQLVQQSADVAAAIAARHRKRIAELLHDMSAFDEQRFQMEVAIMADRADIEEEITRLDSHIRQFRQTLTSSDSVGRKLDFIIQEMIREVNTIGSKAAQTDAIEMVVEMKSELEKIREQVQNVQ